MMLTFPESHLLTLMEAPAPWVGVGVGGNHEQKEKEEMKY